MVLCFPGLARKINRDACVRPVTLFNWSNELETEWDKQKVSSVGSSVEG